MTEQKNEIHHAIPLNRFGDDSDANKIKLTKADHGLVHKILGNSPRGKELMRSYRKAYNSRIFIPISAVSDQEEILQDYFLNLSRLPEWLQKEHVKCVRAVTIKVVSSNLLSFNHVRDFISEVDPGVFHFKNKNIKKKNDSWPDAMNDWLRRRTRAISVSVLLVQKCIQIGLVSISVANLEKNDDPVSRLVWSVVAVP